MEQTMLATCCVPWTEDCSLDVELFRAGVRRQITAGVKDLYVFGTAGEGYAVDEGLFNAVLREFVEECVEGGATPMAGVISLSLRTVLDRIERAAALGVRSFQISLPSWGALNDAELHAFFDAVCGRYPELTFLHYNLPRAQRVLLAGDYAAIAARHPNLVATKQGIADLGTIANILAAVPATRHFLIESAFMFGCMAGEPGLLVAISAINPRLSRAFFEAGLAGDLETLRALHADTVGMRAIIRREVGTTAHMDGAFDKLYCKLHDDRFSLRLLPPYQGVPDVVFGRIKEQLLRAYPHWMET